MPYLRKYVSFPIPEPNKQVLETSDSKLLKNCEEVSEPNDPISGM